MAQEAENLAINTAADVTLPVVDVLTGRGFITGKSGSGKSNSASVIAEELLERGHPICIIDIEGEYYGLKEEYELLHVGADEEAEVVVTPEHAEKLAELALDQRIPLIVDVSGFLDEDDRDEMVEAMARALFQAEQKRKTPFALFVEEIHEYVPEGGGLSDVGKMLVKIGKRGRKRGLGLVGLSQRPADVKKDFITQCDWLVWHRLTWDNDTSVVRRVLGSDYQEPVQDLADGEAFLMADWEADIRQVQFRRKRTFDAGATPDLGDVERPDLKGVGGDLVEELQEISAEVDRRLDRVAELEATVEQKEERIDELEQKLDNQQDIANAAQQMAEALSSGDNGGAAPEIIEEKNERINTLETALSDAESEAESLKERVEELEHELAERPEVSERAAEAVGVLAEEFGVGAGSDEKLRRKLKKARERIEQLEQQYTAVTAPDEYDEFVEDEYVQEAIEEAKSDPDATQRYVKGVIAGILQRGGPASRREIADDLGIQTTSHIRTAMKVLEERDVVTRQGSGDDETADFDFDALQRIHERQARRQRTEGVMERL